MSEYLGGKQKQLETTAQEEQEVNAEQPDDRQLTAKEKIAQMKQRVLAKREA